MKRQKKSVRLSIAFTPEDWERIQRVREKTPHRDLYASRFAAWLASSMAEFIEQGPEGRTLPVVAMMHDVGGLPSAHQTRNPPALIQVEPTAGMVPKETASGFWLPQVENSNQDWREPIRSLNAAERGAFVKRMMQAIDLAVSLGIAPDSGPGFEISPPDRWN